MDEEYDEDKIGDLYGEEIAPKQSKRDQSDLINEAVDEFIDNTKQRFLDLAKDFGTEEQQQRNLIPNTRPRDLVYEEDLKDGEMPEEVKQKLKETQLAFAEQFEEEAIDKMEEGSSESEEEEQAWDAETILTTYTNTDNHPGVIKTERRVRPSQRMKIELHK